MVYLNEPIHNDNDRHYITGHFKNTVGNEPDFVKLETLTSLQQKVKANLKDQVYITVT